MVGEYWVHYQIKGKYHKFASADTPERTRKWANFSYNKQAGIFLTPRKKPSKIRFKRHKGDMTTDMFGGAFKRAGFWG